MGDTPARAHVFLRCLKTLKTISPAFLQHEDINHIPPIITGTGAGATVCADGKKDRTRSHIDPPAFHLKKLKNSDSYPVFPTYPARVESTHHIVKQWGACLLNVMCLSKCLSVSLSKCLYLHVNASVYVFNVNVYQNKCNYSKVC